MQVILFLAKPFRIVLVCSFLFTTFLAKSQINSQPGGGNWSNPATWVGGAVPGGGQTANIVSPVIFDVGSWTVGSIIIANNFTMSGFPRTLTVQANVSGSGTWITDGNRQMISLSGNWSFNGTSAGSGASVEFTGGAAQTCQGVISTGASNGNGLFRVNKTGSELGLTGNVSASNATIELPTGTTGINPGNFILTANAMNLDGGVIIVNATTWAGNYNITQNVVSDPFSRIEYRNANPTIAGTPTVRYRTLTFSGSGTTTASGPIIIEGNLQNTGGGTLNFGSQNVTVSGDASTNQIAGFTTTGTFAVTVPTGDVTLMGNINAGAFNMNFTGGRLLLGTGLTHTFTGNSTLTDGDILGGSSTVRIAGNITGGIGIIFTAETSTVELNGTVPQTVRNFVYNNLTLSGSSLKTFEAGATVNGTLSVRGTATTTGVAPTYGGSSTLEYAGTAAQTTNTEFSAASGPLNLRINNTAGVILNAARTINGALTLTTGILTTTTTNRLTLNTAATTSVGSNTAHVSGPLAKIGNANFTFPVGKSGVYAPIGVSAITASSTFTAEYFRGLPANPFATPNPLSHISACENWQLDRTGTGNANVTLSWGGSSNCSSNPYVTNIATLVVARYNGANWVSAGRASFTGNTASGTITSNQVTAFSPFALGSENGLTNPLPIKLKSFKAYRKNNGVQLEWDAETDQQFKEFIVERSTDASNFTGLTRILSSNTSSEYNWLDASAPTGIIFYRLAMVDIDGKTNYSPVVKIAANNAVVEFSIYPNPVRNGFLSFQSPALEKGNYSIKVFSDNGQEVYTRKFNHSGGAVSQAIQLSAALKAGMYSFQLSGDAVMMSKKFLLQ